MSARRALGAWFALALIAAALAPAAAQADFGIKSFSVSILEQDGTTVDTQAASHPYKLSVSLEMNLDEDKRPEGTLRDVIVELPPGLVGNPLATPRCTGAEFEGSVPQCPSNSQVGIAKAALVGAEESNGDSPIWNLVPPLGVPAAFGFSAIGSISLQKASLRTGSDYGANVSDDTLPTNFEIQSVSEEVWGVPADGSHDAERDCPDPLGGLCKVEMTPVPFLTLPTSCTGPLKFRILVDSLEEHGVFEEAIAVLKDEHGQPVGLTGCSAVPFKPTIEVRPETSTADSPTGLHFNLHLPQSKAPDQLATAHLKDAVVALPPGLAVNPSSADGLAACSAAQIDLHGPGPAQCPEASKLGAVEVHTPLLDHPVVGAVYLAKQGENPFNSLIAVYLAVNDPQTGVIVKLAGKVEPNPLTGQLVTSFKENPQLPFEDVELDLRGGPRAALTTPPTCGTYTTTSDLTPWTSPEGLDAFPSSPFAISAGAGGGACASSEAQMPNQPSFKAGTRGSSLAGAYSPFGLRLSRENGSQRFGALNVTLPPGVSAKLAGVKECSEAQIAAAQARGNPGQGALEQASPSCPAASEVGIVNVGSGSGNPLHVQGRAYLAGPYKGAPLSLAIITPAVTGPFDLGVVVVRSALYVNETTAQVTVKSDPLPAILQGVPLDVRSIEVQVDRPNFSLNPTNCEEMAVSGQAVSTAGQAAALKTRFQVGGCRKLDFSPKLSLLMKGATGRSGHPALKAVLTQPKDQANIARTAVILPPSTFIDQNHIANPCTRVQFNEHNCPPGSVLGKARAFTPLLEEPLEGPLYFRANGGERDLPDIVADLHGKVHLVLVGFVDAVHKQESESSRVRTVFARVPDAPVSKAVFVLRGGKQGLLVNSANICKVPNIATVKMNGHNGKVQSSNQRIATSCTKKKR
jgi:hypothetical protein